MWCNSVAATLFLLFASQPVYAANYQVQLLSPAKGKLYTTFNNALKAELTRLADEQNINIKLVHSGSINNDSHDLVIAVGNRLASEQLRNNGVSNTVFSLITHHFMADQGNPLGENDNVIYTDFKPEQYLQLLHIGLPGAKRVGAIVGENSAINLELLMNKANELGLDLVIKRISQERELLPELELLAEDVDSFLALPDKLVHNRRTARGILLTTYKHRIPVVAYTDSYVNAGATLSLFATPENVAIATANRVIARLIGDKNDDCIEKTTASINSNQHVAGLLGISIPSNRSLKSKIINRLEGCRP